MKANEAPEKIYLYPYPTDGIYDVETEPLEGTVEYARTNIFIEKAVSYIQQHWIWNTKIIEDFKKHMKGE